MRKYNNMFPCTEVQMSKNGGFSTWDRGTGTYLWMLLSLGSRYCDLGIQQHCGRPQGGTRQGAKMDGPGEVVEGREVGQIVR